MDNTTSAVLIAIGTALGLIIRETIGALVNMRSSAHKEGQAIRQDTLNEYKDLLDRHGRRIAELEKSDEEKTKQNTECEKNYQRAVARIEHLEEALTQAKIPFRPWVDRMNPGSAPHTPLPESLPEKGRP